MRLLSIRDDQASDEFSYFIQHKGKLIEVEVLDSRITECLRSVSENATAREVFHSLVSVTTLPAKSLYVVVDDLETDAVPDTYRLGVYDFSLTP